jgi:hypothetical protein
VTITTIRPVSSAGGSTLVNVTGGGGNYITAISDNSDTSYIKGRQDKAWVKPIMGDITLTATQRVKSCTIRIRTARDPGSNHSQTTISRMYVGDTSTPGVGTYQVLRGLTSISTGTGPVAYAAPGGGAWTQSKVNSMFVMIQWLKNAGNDGVFQRVYELYVDVDINEQPTVSGAPVVTNFTNNATPTVSWVFDDDDDDLQTAYQVKIFDAATIASSNFDPETSTAAWDSDQITGSNDSSVTVTKTLLNGVTYTAYVRVAQDWPGPNGPLWWSDWGTSAPFTVTFTPPTAPQISSAAVVQDSNQYRAALVITVPVNLLTSDNASFENSIGTWAALSNCTITRVTTQSLDGSASLRMTSVGAGDMTARCAIDTLGNPVVNGGQTYTALASFKSAAVTGRTAAVGIEWLDAANSIISSAYGTPVTDNTGGWTQAVYAAAAPRNARRARVLLKVISTAGASEQHYIDQVDFHAGSGVNTWTPGGYTNDQGDVQIERGEYLVDDRGPADNWLHPQVADTGSTLRDAAYGFSYPVGEDTLNWGWLDQPIPVQGYTPPGRLDWHPGGVSASELDFGSSTSGGTAFMAPAVPLRQHVFTVWAWCDNGSFVIQPRITWRLADGSVVSVSAGSNVTVNQTPVLLTIVATAPITAALATGGVQNVNSDSQKHVYLTRAAYGLWDGTYTQDGKISKGQPTGLDVNTSQPTGITWQPVRTSGYLGPVGLPTGLTTGQTDTYVDYEYTPGRPVLYRAYIAYSSGGAVVRSPYSNVVTVYGDPPATTLLRSVTDFTLQVAVARRKSATFQTIDDASVFHPLGADGSPIRVRDWVGGEDGQLIVITSNEAQFARLQALTASNDVLEILWAQGGRTYCIITARDSAETISTDLKFCDADGDQNWIRSSVHTLTYIETTAP